MKYETQEEVVYSSGDYECLAHNICSGQTSVIVVMGIHGDEQGPLGIVEDMLEEGDLDYDELDITLIPKANAFAFNECSRETPSTVQGVEADEGDMNRTFEDARRALNGDEGTQDLLTTGQAGYKLLEYIEERDPDLVMDLHTGTSETKKMAQARYKFQEGYKVDKEEMKNAAANAGVDVVAGVPGEGAQMMSAVLPKVGVPAVTLEAGGGERHGKEGSFEQDEAESYKGMVTSILDYMAGVNVSDYEPTECTDIEKFAAPPETPAGSEVKYHVNLGEEVAEDDAVATITPPNEDGDDAEDEKIELKAPYDGIVETVRSGTSRDDIRNGNRIFNIASK